MVQTGLSMENPRVMLQLRSKSITTLHYLLEGDMDFLYDIHFELEFGIVLSGGIRRYYREYERDLIPGDVWFCDTLERHGYHVLQPHTELLVFTIAPQVFSRVKFNETPDFSYLAPFTVKPEHRPIVSGEKRVQVLELGKRLLGIIDSENHLKDLWIRMLLFEVLLLLEEDWSCPPEAEECWVYYSDPIRKALQMIDEKHMFLTTEEVAKACGMCSNSFSKRFKEFIGVSFSDFSLHFRLNGVAEQLLASNDPMKTLASDWGFTDRSHLSRCFAKLYGCLPQEYRRRYSHFHYKPTYKPCPPSLEDTRGVLKMHTSA